MSSSRHRLCCRQNITVDNPGEAIGAHCPERQIALDAPFAPGLGDRLLPVRCDLPPEAGNTLIYKAGLFWQVACIISSACDDKDGHQPAFPVGNFYLKVACHTLISRTSRALQEPWP